jgi:hypothetical protein
VFYVRGYAHEFHHRLVNLEQFSSWLNPLVHSVATAPEIFSGEFGEVDAICCCLGSCGTIGGLLTYIANTGGATQVWGAQPEVSHQVPGTHVIRGECLWNPENFSPMVLGEDRICTVEFVDSMAYTVKLWEKGIPAGPSSGMALALAGKKIRDGLRGNIVVLSADNNFKYPQLLFDELTKHRDEILKRRPELQLEQALSAYLSELEKKLDGGGLYDRISRAYAVKQPGEIREAWDIEEIVAQSKG